MRSSIAVQRGPSQLKTDLRHVLRQETRQEHDALDRAISTLDITRIDGFCRFLHIHHTCFTAMQTRALAACQSRLALADMVDGLSRDLSAVGAQKAALHLALPPRLDPLAVDYMVAGSRLGTKVLHRIWAQATDPMVRQADGYFGLTGTPTLWPDTCHNLSRVPVDTPRAAAIVADTKTLFQLFSTAFDALGTDQDTCV